jgi:uncharacterized delta-60 repeat protein
MKKPNLVWTMILSGSLLLQLSTLCFQSQAAPGDVDLSFDPGSGVNGPVQAVAVQPDGKVIIAGQFTTVKGLARSKVARLNADGSGDSSFNAGTGTGGWEDYAHAVALQSDGKILIAGTFSTVNGTNRNNLARMNADGSLDGSFNPGSGVNGPISAVALQPDGKVLIGGDFTTVNGTNRNRIARLDADGGLDVSFDPGTGADGVVRALALQPDGNVLLSGDFTSVNGMLRPHVARLFGDSAPLVLSIARSNASVTLSWPASGLTFPLQECTTLALPNSWSVVGQPAVTNAGQLSVNIPATVGSRLFRLKSQ